MSTIFVSFVVLTTISLLLTVVTSITGVLSGVSVDFAVKDVLDILRIQIHIGNIHQRGQLY